MQRDIPLQISAKMTTAVTSTIASVKPLEMGLGGAPELHSGAMIVLVLPISTGPEQPWQLQPSQSSVPSRK
jgi:hypothetical protein